MVQTWDLVCQDVIGLMDGLGLRRRISAGAPLARPLPLGVRCAP